MLCGSCGYNNSASAKFCILCGAQLAKSEVQDPDPKICAACGEPNEFHAMFCASCGYDVSSAPRRSTLSPQEGDHNKEEPSAELPEESIYPDETSMAAEEPLSPVSMVSSTPSSEPLGSSHEAEAVNPPPQEVKHDLTGQEDSPHEESGKRHEGPSWGLTTLGVRIARDAILQLSAMPKFNGRVIMAVILRLTAVFALGAVGVAIGVASMLILRGR